MKTVDTKHLETKSDAKREAEAIARLAKLEEAKASEDYARGVADERARVVADLRKRAGKALTFAATRMLQGEADRYERGEHEGSGA